MIILEVMGTVEQGTLKLDQALPLPEHTRVKLTIDLVDTEKPSLEAWERLKVHIRQHPIRGLAVEFSREGLYERD